MKLSVKRVLIRSSVHHTCFKVECGVTSEWPLYPKMNAFKAIVPDVGATWAQVRVPMVLRSDKECSTGVSCYESNIRRISKVESSLANGIEWHLTEEGRDIACR